MSAPIRCRDCSYILEGLDQPRCPECGRPFDRADPSSFTTRLPFIWWKYWFPGFALAAVGGLISYALLMELFGYGWAAALVVPFCMGAIISYGCRVRTAILALLIVVAVLTIPFGLYSGGLAGILCALVLFGVALGGAAIGAVFGIILGWLLRKQLKGSAFDQRDWLAILFLLILPWIFGVIEGRHHYGLERIETSILIPASADDAWNGVVFYEEVHHEPPLLLRMLLPRPLYTQGGMLHAGDVKRCIYSKGHLVKQITQVQAGRLISFRVIEQVNIESRSVRLTGGSFRFEPVGPHSTRVTLMTEYEPLLGPRFAWKWAEAWGTHTLHEHVLKGMMMNAEALEAGRQAR